MTVMSKPGERDKDIPQNLIFDFDLYDTSRAGEDYQASVTFLHASGVPDVFWTPRNGGHWVVTRAADMDEVFKNPAVFSSKKWNIPVERNPIVPNVPLNLDPPEHAKYRQLIALALAPKAVAQLTEKARAKAIELIEGFVAKGGCNFVEEFALHLPIEIFLSIVDLPLTDRKMLLDLVEPIFRPQYEAQVQESLYKTAAYVQQKIAERKANPGTDLISQLTQARIDGEPINDERLLGMVMLLLGGGLDTVASMLGFFALFLAKNPGHRKQLIEHPELIPNAVEELLRRFSIVTPGRIVTQPIDFKGVPMKPGDMVALMTALYGNDERRFDDPLSVNFKRENINHGAFGQGVHRCAGSMLGRNELKIFLEEWLKRVPDFSVKPGSEVRFAVGVTATLTHLELVW